MSKAFLGKGWAFPLELKGNMLNYSLEEKKIEESIMIILGTAQGERVMRPDFGSRLHELVFAPINTSTKGMIAHYVTDALTTWEPRVDVTNVAVSDQEASRGLLLVSIEYRIRATNSVFNLVYPFYLTEGRKA
jgi:uncharacterized protein